MYKTYLFTCWTIVFTVLFPPLATGQNTVGVMAYSPGDSYEGYNLVFPHNQSSVFLLDNCGQIIHTWEDSAIYRPGNSVYLLENGNLLKCKRNNAPINDPIWAGGGGAIVELRDWDNTLLWSFEQNNDSARLHHDIAPMPNGNVLLLSWELKTEAEALAAGRDPAKIAQGKLWPDYLFEINPNTNEIVWEWHAWDHLVQDIDPTKNNFGNVADHPERIDINYDTHDGHPDWLHANAIDYNPVLDHILICVPYFDEVWIIDHSTTTEEAAGSSGGKSGKGGDLLYRWGNPMTYRNGTEEDKKMFFPHDIHWVDPMAEVGSEDFGRIALFNNRVGANYSTANTFVAPFDTASQRYSMLLNGRFSPASFAWTVKHPQDSTLFFSNSLSSAQVLPNGNMLMMAGRFGNALEISPQNEIVWAYTIPLRGGQPVDQGETLSINNNITFRLTRYGVDFPAFVDKELSPIGYWELNPNVAFCNMLLPIEPNHDPQIKIYPNPGKAHFHIESNHAIQGKIAVFDIKGAEIFTQEVLGKQFQVSTSTWKPGLYFVHLPRHAPHKLVILP